jgi:hypothetical protein
MDGAHPYGKMITVVTMFAPAKERADCEIALWRLRASSRKANLRGVFHSFIKKSWYVDNWLLYLQKQKEQL